MQYLSNWRFNRTISVFILIASLVTVRVAHGLTCEHLFSSIAVSKGFSEYRDQLNDPHLFFKVLAGEIQVPSDVLLINLEHFQNYKTKPVNIAPLTKIEIPNHSDEVVVRSNINPKAKSFPSWLFSENQATVDYYIHPTNESSNIPYFLETGRHLPGPEAVTSASRSMFVRTNNGGLFSIKMGTDYPEGKSQPRNLKKLNGIQNEVEFGINHTAALMDLKARFYSPRKFSLVNEVLSVTPQTEIVGRYGMMVRDLSFLKNKKRFYLPAFSIPYIGAAIAKKHGKDYAEFWGNHFAKSLGEAKAELFLKYGVLMDWPHGQNILIETDLNFRPTGKFVFRDLDDMKFYTPAAQYLLNDDQYYSVLHTPKVNFQWERTEQILIPIIQRETAPAGLYALAGQWKIQHDRAIRKAFAKALNIENFNDESMDLEKLLIIFKTQIESYFKSLAEQS